MTLRAFGIIFVNVALAIILIWSLGYAQPTIHQRLFPYYQEAEIQTYIFGVLIFFCLQVIFYPLFKIKNSVLFIILIIFGIPLLLGAYRFTQSLGQRAQLRETLWWMGIYQIDNITTWDFLIGITIFVSVILFLLPRTRLGKYWRIAFQGMAVLIIFWLTWGIAKLNLYDYTHYAGPIHEYLSGRPLLTFRSWYGFLPILFLSGIFRIIPLTAANLHVTIASFQFLGFVFYYRLLSNILKDARWALFATVYAIFSYHIVIIGGLSEHPQSTFIRMGLWVSIALLIFYRARVLVPIAVAIAFFWTLDFGIYVVAAYCLYLVITNLDDNITLFSKRYVRLIVFLLMSIFVIFILINIYYLARYQILPQWSTHYFFMANYQASNHMLPVPNAPMLWLSVLVPVAAISYLINQKQKNGNLGRIESAVLFTACVALTQFIYFLGRTTLNQLHAISLPIFLCAFYLIKISLERLRDFGFPITIAAVLLVGIILGLPGTLLFYQGLQNIKVSNPLGTLKIVRGEVFDEYDWFSPTTDLLMSRYGSEIRAGNLTLLSIWDTWYLTILGTTNRVGINCQLCYIPDENVDFQVTNIRKSPSDYLFLDSMRTPNEFDSRVEKLYQKIKSEYQFVETLGLLDVYKRI